MARRSIWNGAISFGMVVIPVKLYTATESKDIAFVTLHKTCNNRIRQKRYCSFHESEVEMVEIVKGYEYAKEQYVVMDQADFDGLPVASTHTIEIVRFVDLADIDPVYFERSYALEPDRAALKPFYLLKRALENTSRVAIAKISLRQKEHLACLRPYGQGIVLDTMFYPDEIRGLLELSLPEESAVVTDQEMSMAITLIDQLTGPFEPDQHHDEYRTTLERVIEAKLTEDDGTARDKVTRVQHLGALSMEGQPPGQRRFEVVACIAGRGFGVRREDMKKLLLATRGKVFTLQNMCQLVEHTRLGDFRSR